MRLALACLASLLLSLPPVARGGDSIRILALGDSYTIGEGVAEDARWPNQFANLLRAHGRTVEPPQIIAATGWTTFDLHRAMSRAGLESPYDIVTLLIGVNDQYQGQSADTYRDRFGKLLADAVVQAGGDGARVLVLSIPDYSLTPFAERMDTARIRAELKTFNTINGGAARDAGARYVDLSPATLDLAADGLHPSAKMYEQWAQLVADVFEAARGGP
jgi:lysophospholipase L1-like esterase